LLLLDPGRGTSEATKPLGTALERSEEMTEMAENKLVEGSKKGLPPM
jgi:hypothetical protein